jgi:predicted nucleic acid-binding protein
MVGSNEQNGLSSWRWRAICTVIAHEAVVVDSSVWIDYFNAKHTQQTEMLDRLLDTFGTQVIVPDVVLAEVLRGFRLEREYQNAKKLMATFSIAAIGGAQMALDAAANYRSLRSVGVTIRNFVDVWIATFCITHDLPFIHNDRDYDPLEQHRGLLVLHTLSDLE